MSSLPCIQKLDILGGPITCVSFRSTNDELLYGQGPWLHRIFPWNNNNNDNSTNNNNKVLIFPHGGSIHGIRHHQQEKDTIWIFGGRLLTRVLLLDKTTTVATTTTEIHSLSDWIWDCRIINDDNNNNNNNDNNNNRMICIGYAHNRIEIRHAITLQQIICFCQDESHRISNSINIHANDNNLVSIAMGTVLNDIWIWEWHHPTVKTPTTTSKMIDKYRLCGHQGVIHAMQFFDSNTLVSASDDRTVRLWKKNNNNKTNNIQQQSWTLQWTAWGHSARIFSVAFSKHWNSQNDNHLPAWIFSTGEDSSLRVWDTSNGALLQVFKGHSCQIVWCVDSIVASFDASSLSCTVATGANNGTVAFYNLQTLIQTRTKQSISKQETNKNQSLIVPEDHPTEQIVSTHSINTNEIDDDKKKKKPKQKRKMSKQTVVGMQFGEEQGKTGRNLPFLIVATRSGSVWKANLETNTWSQCQPWWSENHDHDGDASKNEGCCMCLHPQGSLVTVGTHLGDVILSNIDSADRLVLDARQQRAVQRVHWMNDSTLISFHVRAAILWKFAGQELNDAADIPRLNMYTASVLQSDSSGMGISYAYNSSTSLLVIGDTRGNLSLFDVNNKSSDSHCTNFVPISVVKKAHRKEHVTNMLWKDDRTLLSVGNDACVVESRVENDGTLCTLLSVAVNSFSALTHIWSLSLCGDSHADTIVLAGYFGNRFAVMDYSTGYEFCGVETGGRQRALELYKARAAAFSFPRETVLAVVHTLENGRNEIMLHNFCELGVHSSYFRTSLQHYGGFPLHGESIFDIAIFQLDQKQDIYALLSGSEDCSSVVSVIRKGVAVSKIMLPLDVSGVRAVCCHQMISGDTFIAIGGKLTLQFFVVEHMETSTNQNYGIRFLGKGNPPIKPTIDHRMNYLTAYPTKDSNSVIVAAGDSDGCCYLYIVSASCKGRLLHRNDYPVLCMYSVEFVEFRLLLMGTTAGEVIVFIAPQTSSELESLDNSTEPIFRYKAHSMGTNAITAIPLELPGNIHNVLRICTGGDDQALCCSDIQISHEANSVTKQASALRLLWAKEASVSAFKGIAMVDENRFVVSGYDQQLSMWQVDDDGRITKIISKAVDIGDINCFSMCKASNGQYLVGVAGAGVELFAIDV